MPRRSNRQVAKILSSAAANRKDPSLAELDRKVTLSTEDSEYLLLQIQ